MAANAERAPPSSFGLLVTAKAKPARRKKPHAPGPHSPDEKFSRLDRRTRAGRIMRTVEANLASDLADPTTAERLIIQSVSIKAVRLALLSDTLLSGEEPSGDAHGVLAWTNSMRLDLMALGLQRRAKNVVPDLQTYLASKSKAGAVE